MIILTGGAGMIGSMVAWHLNNEMNFNDFVIVDDLVNEQQEYNFNKRDFIYVKDAVKVVIFFLNNSKFSGVYNVGTSNPETFKALAEAVLSNNTGNPDEIKYINMPNDLKGKYQYYTKARIDKIRSIGFGDNFKNLNEGVKDYLKNYLLTSDRYA